MTRNRSLSLVLTAALSGIALHGAAVARPAFIKFDGIDGEVVENNNLERTIVNGQPVVVWETPSGFGELVFRPSIENRSQPMESLSLNFTKITFNTTPVQSGASATVADDVWVDGRIITAAIWARWTKQAGEGLRIDFGRSAEAAGVFDVTLKRGQIDVHTYTCSGSPIECDPWFLGVTCPELECSVLCPSLCGVPSVSRPEPVDGVAIDLPLPGPTTFSIPGGGAVTADTIVVSLRPGRSDPAFELAGTRLAVQGLPGLQINSARGEFGCPADINESGELSVQDIFDFLAKFFAASPDADFNNSGGLSVQDLFDFLAAYFRGC